MNLTGEKQGKGIEQNFESHGHGGVQSLRRHIGQVPDLGQLILNKSSTIGPSSNSQRFSGSSTPLPTMAAVGATNIRKYLVLLQDSLAIKFVPYPSLPLSVVNGKGHSLPIPSLSSRNNVGDDLQATPSRNRSHLGVNDDEAQEFGQSYASNSCKLSDLEFKRREHCIRKSFSRPSSSASMTFPTLDPVASELDHSLQGLYLYKGFREANLRCHWNTSLHEALRNLEYKGYLVPFTVLLSATNPRFLTTIRVAWSRQMLRSPSGYQIELIGEIEEVLADPIQQSQFAPLSDSLCWAILEVTSSGQEAFVDSILTALTSYFPTMIMPNRELVYRTLEKLIRERKVYQTPSGYFVVTPDTFRYMVSTSPLPQPRSSLHESPSKPPPPTVSTTTLTLDTSNPISSDPQLPPHDPDKVSRNSLDSTASAENPVRERGREKERGGDECRDHPLRRHNSLKMIRQRDKEAGNSLKFLRGRSLSFRLYKSKSTPIGSEGFETPPGKENKESSLKEDKVDKKVKSGKSFFKKLFGRSSSKKSTAEAVLHPPGGITETVSKSATAATQTSSSEALEVQRCPGSAKETQKQGRTSFGNDTDRNVPSSRPTILQIDCDNDNDDGVLGNRWDSLPRPERSSSRLSSNTPTLLDDGNIYSYTTQNGDSRRINGDNGHSDAAYPFPRDEFSRCSSLSRGTSLGYGSQGPTSSLVGVCQSPTPSMSPSNYAGYSSRRSVFGPPPAYSHMMSRNSPSYGSYKASYDYYRRRYPGYGSYRQHPATTGSVKGLNESKPTTDTVTMTGRPNSQSHYYETIGFPCKSPPPDHKKSTRTEAISGSTPKKSENHIRTTFPSPRINKRKVNEDPFVSTTTVTQKSTTNMEVELRLPLGKFSSRGGRSNGSILINGNDTKFNVNVGNGGSECPGGTKIHIAQPRNETEVKTTVSHSNGTVKTHFDYCDGQGAKNETNENLGSSSTKSRPNEASGSGIPLKPQKSDVPGIRLGSYDFAVKDFV